MCDSRQLHQPKPLVCQPAADARCENGHVWSAWLLVKVRQTMNSFSVNACGLSAQSLGSADIMAHNIMCHLSAGCRLPERQSTHCKAVGYAGIEVD
jgi:hypothetical protein